MARNTIQLYLSRTTWVAAISGTSDELTSGVLQGEDGTVWSSLGQTLRQRFPLHRSVRVILSARRCQFLVAPWAPGCFTGRAIRDYVAQLFAELHNVLDATHHIEIDWPPYGQPILAVAYPRAAIETLCKGLADSNLTTACVMPSIAPVIHRFAGKLSTPSALLAYAEDDGVTGITFDAGQVVQVEALSGQCGGLEDCALWFARKRFAFDDDRAMHWLATAPAPDGFSGTPLPCGEEGKPASPGHALVGVAAL